MSAPIQKLKNVLSSLLDDIVMTLIVLTVALLTAQIVFGATAKQKNKTWQATNHSQRQ